ncbi:MAG TPA: hypothetical protein VFO34_01195 [Candidatus Acidoferrales bacterium]|nr:hypothetical protein [Candidatus Acidoferrales bacterium]
MKRRVPVTVILIGIVMFVAAALAALVAYSLIFADEIFLTMVVMARPGLMFSLDHARLFGALFVAVALIVAYGAMGFLRGRMWAWWFAVALFAVNGCGDVMSFFATHDLVRSGGGLAVVTVFLVVLNSNGVRDYFGRKSKMEPLINTDEH